VTFPACPPPNDAAIEKVRGLEELTSVRNRLHFWKFRWVVPEAIFFPQEAALDTTLRNRVGELVNDSGGNIELPHILQQLSEENIQNLPPGGGLSSK